MDDPVRIAYMQRVAIKKQVHAKIKELNNEYSPRINALKAEKKAKWQAIFNWRDAEYERLGL
jgi:phage host-nuclease inhibitor protein Gam